MQQNVQRGVEVSLESLAQTRPHQTQCGKVVDNFGDCAMMAGELFHNDWRQVMKFTIIGLILFLLVVSTWAGTYQDDFEVEQNFLDDKQNGVWKLDVNSFTWEDGAIRGIGNFNLLMFGLVDWTNYTLEVKVKPLTNSRGAMGIRHNNGPHYVYWLDESVNKAGITKSDFTLLIEESVNVEPDTWYSLKGVAEDDNLEFYVNGELIMEVKDTSYSKGRAGICVVSGTVFFDDFILTGPDVPDGGHGTVAVEPKAKLATTWAKIKQSR